MSHHIRSTTTTSLTALDTWIGMCYAFLIAALVESIAACNGYEKVVHCCLHVQIQTDH